MLSLLHDCLAPPTVLEVQQVDEVKIDSPANIPARNHIGNCDAPTLEICERA